MSPYMVFFVESGAPEQDTAKLITDEDEALAHAKLLCKKNGIDLDKFMAEQQDDSGEVYELDIDYFEIGIGFGEHTISGRIERTVYAWDMDEE